MKKNIIKILAIYTIFITNTLASGPAVVCEGLPGCNSGVTGKSFFGFIGNIISAGIKYVAVVSVISLVIAGMMYLTSAGEEEQVKKARKWIIWALTGVLISTSAWTIINLANSFKIN